MWNGKVKNALVFDWALSSDEAQLVVQLMANEHLYDAITKRIAAAENEACAVDADNERSHDADELNEQHEQDPRSVDRYWLGWNDAAHTIAAAIRARGSCSLENGNDT